ncbi:DUF3726 domain-containing protein [Candidatus Pelagibacter sp. RS39]|uniref:DUF3726 domain-containing protein n=1 Tax=Candidatus Pelagibacter sp. RS39 TaxID=1977864 RepID=UPI000A15E851|nr:DUF3726 domain-containing protein [Candidatus Pelagibacter sp. RS39]ARJ47668.1 hypothetical protein B5L73_02415 [Candidatus Pelagibacter sp. RS39]
MKSLSEIETISKRASRASGYSWGISEEVGKSIRLLEMFSFKGVKNLNEYLKEKKDKKFENLNLITENNKCLKFSYCPIILGVSFLDQIENLEKIKKINFSKIAFPLLFLPFLSKSSEVIGKKISFKFEKNEFLLNINVNIATNLLNENCPNLATNAEVKILENNDNFMEQDWKNLYQLSEKTFVEETESLKKGAAGAGLTDND